MTDTEIWFHTPGAADLAFPYHVVAGGRTLTQPGDPPVMRRYHQHVLIQTIAGTGAIREAGRRRRAATGTVTWLDTRLDYAHGCHPSAPSWQYLWIGVQGFGLDLLFEQASVAVDPVTFLADPSAFSHGLERILKAMRDRDPLQGATNAAAVAALLAQMLADRRRPLGDVRSVATRPIDRALLQLRHALARPWRIADIAGAAGLSVSQLHRVFLVETGLSPMAWLRQERINAAKLLLLDHARSVRVVAESVGYLDPFHFSRDFKALTGRPPRDFRSAGGA
jgi:AraC-like DNA-binding protein